MSDNMSYNLEDQMSTTPRLTRQKISTTISPKSYAHLDGLIRRGEAQTLAEALDLAIERLLVYENRERLANDTAAYFENLSPEAAEEEERLAEALSGAAKDIDFDREP
jgi:hypothetical protein